jgi:hypothetical protein
MKNQPLFFWFVYIAAGAMLGAYIAAATVVWRYGGASAEFGWHADRSGGAWRVSHITPGGPADGRLAAGDVVLAIDGHGAAARIGPFYDISGYETVLRFVRADLHATPYVVRVDRGGTVLDVALRPVVRREPRAVATTLSLLATSLAFFVVGVFVGLSRPRDRLPRLLALASLPSAGMLLVIAIQPYTPFISGWPTVLRATLPNVYPFHYLLAYALFLRVAAHGEHAPFWRNLERALWIVGVPVALLRTTAYLISVPEWPPAIAFAARHADAFYFFSEATLTAQRLYNPVLTLAVCGVLAANYRRGADPTERRRLKWIVFGTVVGLGPLFLEAVIRSLLAMAGLSQLTMTATFQFFYRLATTAPILVPLTFGYAISRHRLLGVQVVMRRGVQYLLARNVLRLAVAVPIVGLVYNFATNADRTVAQIVLDRSASFYGLLLAAALASVTYRTQLSGWLDRRFFREVYNQERILLELIDRLKSGTSIAEMSRLVCARIQEALHPTALHVFYRDPEHPEFASGYSSSGAHRAIPETLELVALMQQRTRVLDVPSAASRALPASEEQWLTALGVTMVVAMRGAEHRLCGLMLMGEKKSEEAYSPGDRELLQAIADQTAILWENLWLKDGVRREQQIRRDVLARVGSHGIDLLKECPACGSCFERDAEICPGDGTPLTLTLPVERTIDNRYRLDRRLGRGGMGVVYAACDLRLQRDVAIKILHGGLFGEREALRRFEREALLAGRLNHPGIVRVYDYGVIGSSGAYLVMERLDGSTWRDHLTECAVMAPPLLASRLDQVLDGLDAAHQQGLVHRDLKPENLMIAPRPPAGTVKILDFGLAKLQPSHGAAAPTLASMTAPGALLGTYAYMSPEQLSGATVDARSDLFALAVLTVESATGRRPFPGSTLADQIRAVLHDAFHLAGDRPEIRHLDACLQQALAKHPAERYQSASEMRGALIPALSRCTHIVAGTDRASAEIDTEVR